MLQSSRYKTPFFPFNADRHADTTGGRLLTQGTDFCLVGDNICTVLVLLSDKLAHNEIPGMSIHNLNFDFKFVRNSNVEALGTYKIS